MIYYTVPKIYHYGALFERWFLGLPDLHFISKAEIEKVVAEFKNAKSDFFIPLLKEVMCNQPKEWNPASPHNSPASRLFNLVKEKLLKSGKVKESVVNKSLRFYVAVGSRLDIMCQTDCAFTLYCESVHVTVDLTSNPNKKESHADIILSLTDLESLTDEGKADEIARLLIVRYRLEVTYSRKKRISYQKKGMKFQYSLP
ncbi:MAG: hypothetical protein WCJ59_01685 [bacterium]